jgi:hypothetical protein
MLIKTDSSEVTYSDLRNSWQAGKLAKARELRQLMTRLKEQLDNQKPARELLNAQGVQTTEDEI